MIVIERLVAEILMAFNSQTFKETLPGFEIVAEVECVECTFAAQDEISAFLPGQRSKEKSYDGGITNFNERLGLVQCQRIEPRSKTAYGSEDRGKHC
jgi:hypothetical protein